MSNNLLNIIQTFLSARKLSIQKDGSIKKGKKFLSARDVYAEFATELINIIELSPFENIINHLTKRKQAESPIDPTLYSDLVAKCDFVLKKFRWFVTSDFVKFFYFKTSENAEQYKYVTSDVFSDMFYNCLNADDCLMLQNLILQYNLENPDKIIASSRKFMSYIIAKLDETQECRLDALPKIMSNNPLEPCCKFFDIKRLEESGDKYKKEHGVNPPTPCWDQFFARVRMQEMVPVIKAFLTGIFMDNNKTKQVLYIFGNGNDGKTQITESLAVAMGDDVTFVLAQNMKSNQFSSFDAFGKRLFLGEELQSPNALKTGLLHAITGGSRVKMEQKGKQAFQVKSHAIGVITSNYAPNISDVTNQKSRLIYVEVDPPPAELINKEGSNWAKGLQEEFNRMIYSGLQYYRELNPAGSSFKLPPSHDEFLETQFDEKSIYLQNFIEEVFEYNESSSIRCRLRDGFIKYVEEKTTEENLTHFSITNEYRDNTVSKEIFEKLLKKFPNICHSSKNLEEKRIRIIKGLSIKSKNLQCAEILSIN